MSAQKNRKWIGNYRPLMHELILRDLKVKYRRSFLGYLWSLLNPLMMMMVMSYIFSNMFTNTITNFPLYLICGQTLFGFFNEATNMAMNSVIGNGALIKKVYIPKVVFPVSRVLSSFVTMSFSLIAIVIVMLFTKANLYPTMLLFWVPLAFLFVFSCGMGLILSSLSVYFRDITHLYGVLTMAWMYGTPIFYDPNIMPMEVKRVIMLNPLYHYIDFFRNVVIYNRIPSASEWEICLLTSSVMFLAGLFLFHKLEKNFILYI